MALVSSTGRTRHPVGASKLWLLKLCGFRYSVGRDAYVLRLVGNRIGPVFRVSEQR